MLLIRSSQRFCYVAGAICVMIDGENAELYNNLSPMLTAHETPGVLRKLRVINVDIIIVVYVVQICYSVIASLHNHRYDNIETFFRKLEGILVYFYFISKPSFLEGHFANTV